MRPCFAHIQKMLTDIPIAVMIHCKKVCAISQ